MTEPSYHIFTFGNLTLDTRSRRLFKADGAVPLAPKSFELLRILVEGGDRAISKAELLQTLWPDVQVEEGNLSFQIAVLRKALGPQNAGAIVTVPRYGYRFSADVVRSAAPIIAPDPSADQAVRRQEDSPLAGADMASQLPLPRTPLLGRQQELAALSALLLNDEVRLVTITGAGGSGKTRIAVQAAADAASHFPGGVYFSSMVTMSDPQMVAPALAQTVGLRHTGAKTVPEALYEHLSRVVHAPALLVIDNFEHVLAATSVLAGILEHCRTIKLLVTTRAVLHIYGEHEIPLTGLMIPALNLRPALEDLSVNPSIKLFVERAAAVNPGFELTRDNVGAVAEICIRLDGLPLAIELAAARARMLPPAAILSKMDKCLDFLSGGARDLPARHQTIRATIEWSYALLSSAEQKLFQRIAVFAGGCTLESVEAVCDARSDLGLDVLDGVSALVEQSILHRSTNKEDVRFSMLETVREYALERLALSGEEDATKRAHAAYCLVLAEEGQMAAVPSQIEQWLRRCEDEQGNFREAIGWLVRQGRTAWAVRMGIALFPFWERHEHFNAGRSMLQAVLGMEGALADTKERAMVAACAGSLAASIGDTSDCDRMHREALNIYRSLNDDKGIATQLNLLGANLAIRGNYSEARSLLEQSLGIWRQLGDPVVVAGVLSNLADAVSLGGDHERARVLLEEALSIFRELGDEVGMAWSYNYLGDVARDEGDGEAARARLEQSVNAFRRIGHLPGLARSLSDSGYLACERGDYADAVAYFDEALLLFLQLDLRRGVARVLGGFALIASARDDFEGTLQFAGSAAALRQSVAAHVRPSEQARLDAALSLAWKSLGEAAASAAWQKGWRMNLHEAVELAQLIRDSATN